MSDGMPRDLDELTAWLGNAYNAGYRQAITNAAPQTNPSEINEVERNREWLGGHLDGLKTGEVLVRRYPLSANTVITSLQQEQAKATRELEAMEGDGQ